MLTSTIVTEIRLIISANIFPPIDNALQKNTMLGFKQVWNTSSLLMDLTPTLKRISTETDDRIVDKTDSST